MAAAVEAEEGGERAEEILNKVNDCG